jgi:hypothetical protein
MWHTQLWPAILASLITSAIMFVAGYVYEGYRVRAVALTQLEALVTRVAALEQRLLDLERKK